MVVGGVEVGGARELQHAHITCCSVAKVTNKPPVGPQLEVFRGITV